VVVVVVVVCCGCWRMMRAVVDVVGFVVAVVVVS